MSSSKFHLLPILFLLTGTLVAEAQIAPLKKNQTFFWGHSQLAEQSYDTSYVAPIPFLPANTGTTVYIDAGHQNFHTADKRYKPFADLLKNDGYQVAGFTETFSAESLSDVEILVIANPVNPDNSPEVNWVSPIKSAFTDTEISSLVDWVKGGGSLMLIADHFPFPGAVDELAREFGLVMDNGYNFDPAYFDTLAAQFLRLPTVQAVFAGTADPSQNATIGQIIAEATPLFIELGASLNSLVYWPLETPESAAQFAAGDGTAKRGSILFGRPNLTPLESVPYVVTFTGQSFTYTPVEGQTFYPLFEMGEGTYTALTQAQDAYFGETSQLSDQAMLTSLLTTQKIPEFIVDTVSSSDKYQAALIEVGAGKVAVFGEAGMFTAQLAADGVTKMGMNSEQAPHNWQFALNIMHYLDDLLEYTATTIEEPSELPSEIQLFQNYPNPFNPSTQIRFSIPAAGHVALSVFDITGKEVATLINQTLQAGFHTTTFNADQLSNGVYLYRLTFGNQQVSRAMMLVK